MNRFTALGAAVCILVALFIAGCERKVAANSATVGTGPVPTNSEPDFDPNNFKVAHPERSALITAGEYDAAPELPVTGVVSPDVSRQVPVPSLATGRVIEIDAQLGDSVQKGQLLFKVRSTDIAGAYSDYLKAVKNEELTKIQLNRAKVLYEDGAIPKSQLEVAQNAEDDALVDLKTSTEHLQLLGADPEHPSGIVNVYAPVSGVITDQQITNQAGVQALSAPNPFTISDITHVWILCDVYENDVSQVHLGEFADIRLAGYPSRLFKARIANIMPIMDPNIRTLKVRLELPNPGLMRFGMFVTATFHGETAHKYAIAPATAILHLHDRDWVYKPLGGGRFRRTEVTAGNMLPDNMQQVISGVSPGEQLVKNALVFQNTVEQ